MLLNSYGPQAMVQLLQLCFPKASEEKYVYKIEVLI